MNTVTTGRYAAVFPLSTGVAFLAAILCFPGTAACEECQNWATTYAPFSAGVRHLAAANGELVADGSTENISRWNGSSWQSMAGGMNGKVLALTAYNGAVVAGGDFTAPYSHIAWWDGSRWHSVGSGMNGSVNQFTEFDGDLVAAGSFTTAGGNACPYIARWNLSTWQPLGNPGSTQCRALAVSNGWLVGAFDKQMKVWNGADWLVFGDANAPINALAISNGYLVVGGMFTSISGVSAKYIAVWDGSRWNPMGGGTNYNVWALSAYEGKLLVGGEFLNVGNIYSQRIAQWDGSKWIEVYEGLNGACYALSEYNGQVIAGGDFVFVGLQPIHYVARLFFTTPPTITQQPASATFCQGPSAHLCVTATGTMPLQYQWYKDGAYIANATSSCYDATQSGTYYCIVHNSCSSVSSNTAAVTVIIPPAVTQQPQSATICQGESVDFCVTASGTSPAYQWQKNQVNISGASSPCYKATEAGNYRCVVTNTCGTATSNTVSLTVNTPAKITSTLPSRDAIVGTLVSFTITATGTPAPTYQWRKNGVALTDGGNLAGTKTATLTINPVGLGDSGAYDVLVQNACAPGGVASNVATLQVGYDCNSNSIADNVDIGNGTSSDCNHDGIPDECQNSDCNGNGVMDVCDIAAGTSPDCNDNLVPDDCDIASGTSQDCNRNQVPDECDLSSGMSADCNANGIPDECERNLLFVSGFAANSPQQVSTVGGQVVQFRGWGFRSGMSVVFTDGINRRVADAAFVVAADRGTLLSVVVPSFPPGCDCGNGLPVRANVLFDNGCSNDTLARSGATIVYTVHTVMVHSGGNVQAAVDSAVPGTCLVLESGHTYAGPVVIGGTKTAITLTSNDLTDAGLTQIDGGYRGGPVVANPTVTLDGCDNSVCVSYLNIILGNGGVQVQGAASPILKELIVDDNVADASHGGGLTITGLAEPTVLKCKIAINTTAGNGGGVRIDNAGGMFVNDIVQSNTVTYGGHGGGVYLKDVLPGLVIADSEVRFNQYDGPFAWPPGGKDGGGIYMTGGTEQQASGGLLLRSKVWRNTLVSEGAGVFVDQYAAPVIVGSAIYSNTGLSEYAIGGGIYVQNFNNKAVTVCGSLIYDNEAQIAGGIAITKKNRVALWRNLVFCNRVANRDWNPLVSPPYYAPGIYVEDAAPSVLHNTVYNNTGADNPSIRGGGIHAKNLSTGSPRFLDNILLNNQGWEFYSDLPISGTQADWNLGYDAGEPTRILSPFVNAGTHNLSVNPLLAGADCGAADPWDAFSLQVGSPAACSASDKCDLGAAVSPGSCSGCNVTDCMPVVANDCNRNGIPDGVDLLVGTLVDQNLNGIPDSCEIVSNSGDFDGDGDVDLDDLSIFQSCFSGPAIPRSDTPTCQATDIDEDGDVDQIDFGIFQQQYQPSPSGALSITEPGDFVSAGARGGPFTPASKTYTLTNAGPRAVLWSVTTTVPWLSIAPKSNGTLAPGGVKPAQVTVSINANVANSLPIGRYVGTVTFTNETNGSGNDTRTVTMTVTPSVMDLVPAGEFLMGNSFDPSEGEAKELPRHTVYVDAFRMDRYEVTNQQYADALNWAWGQGGLITVMNGVVYQAGSGTNYPYCDTTTSSSYSRIVWSGSTFGVVPGKEGHPMVMVSWYGSVACANWRSAMQGKPACYDLSTWDCNFGSGYRLPTEAEWEKAARCDAAGRRFPWSDSDAIQHTRANYYSWAGYSYDTSPTREYHPLWGSGAMPFTSTVGFFNGELRRKVDCGWPGTPETYQTTNGANSYGLHDMAGNVSEWCNDWYSDAYYSSSPYSNPHGPSNGLARVLRGGSWMYHAYYARSAYRDYPAPATRANFSGFRLALNAK